MLDQQRIKVERLGQDSGFSQPFLGLQFLATIELRADNSVCKLSRGSSCDSRTRSDRLAICWRAKTEAGYGAYSGKTRQRNDIQQRYHMDTCQANSREYLQQAIDAEIESLEKSIRSLKHRRNALAPISSLPTEVISTIFSLLRAPVASSPLKPPTPSEKPDRLPWIRLSHVCHNWREIALNQPLFWNHLHFSNFGPAGAGEMLARAKMVPLHLEANVPEHWDNSQFSTFQKELHMHASHICRLDIVADLCRFSKVVEGLVSPAPILEILSLVCGGFPSRAMSSGVGIPDTLFDGTIPRLSCLKLQRCNISWGSPFLKGLRCLEIRFPSARARPSLSEWLDTLDEMPQLQMLVLHEASPIALPTPLPSIKRTITLPSLSILDFSASARDCGLALAHLILPALSRLCLAARSDLQDGGDVQEMLPYLSRHASVFQRSQSMIIRGDRMCTDMLAWADVRSPKPTDFLYDIPSSPLAFSFMDQNWPPQTRAAVFDAAMAALPLENLLSLTAQNCMNHFEKQVWLHHAPRWPLLQCVCLSRSAVRAFMEMVLEDFGGRERPLLPSLITLVLVDAQLSARRTLCLCDALMTRVEQGVPLETLDLHTCLATSRAVDLLNEIVVDVLGPMQALQQKAKILSVWNDEGRGLFVRDISSNSGMEDDDDDDPLADTGSDDDIYDNWDRYDDDEDEEDYW